MQCPFVRVAKENSCLQMVQNAAARILSGSSKYEHISPVLASLHWLPVQVRADFKVLLFTSPSYLTDLVKCASTLLALSGDWIFKCPEGKKEVFW